MKKLISLIAIVASLSLHATDNPAGHLPPQLPFILGIARPAAPLTQEALNNILQEEKATKRAQRQERVKSSKHNKASQQGHKQWTTPKKK